MDKHTAVLANSMYVDKTKVAEDVSFELPSLALQTADINAMGPLSLPIAGLLENMTMTIKKVGVDKGYGSMNKLEKMAVEFRWVQDKVNASGNVTHVGCKAFLNVVPQEIPGIDVEVGSATELSGTYTVLRYQLYVDGVEVLLVDRLNQILRINGVDYMADIKKLL